MRGMIVPAFLFNGEESEIFLKSHRFRVMMRQGRYHYLVHEPSNIVAVRPREDEDILQFKDKETGELLFSQLVSTDGVPVILMPNGR